jgi:hypothetical protein
VGRPLLVRERIDQRLRVLGLECDDAGELALEMRVIGIEPLGDEISMLLILREDDGLAQSVATGNRQPACHQVFQHLVDSVLVE